MQRRQLPWQKLAQEDWSKREGIHAHKGHTKYFSEHLGPLRRFLGKRVGRPWDSVFAEICQHIRVDSAVQSHVRDHVFDFVEIHVTEINGVLCHGSGWRIGRPLESGGRWMQFYVCPRTGLLCTMKARPRKSPERHLEKVAIDEMHEYRLMDGIWYLLEYNQNLVFRRNARVLPLSTAFHMNTLKLTEGPIDREEGRIDDRTRDYRGLNRLTRWAFGSEIWRIRDRGQKDRLSGRLIRQLLGYERQECIHERQYGRVFRMRLTIGMKQLCFARQIGPIALAIRIVRI